MPSQKKKDKSAGKKKQQGRSSSYITKTVISSLAVAAISAIYYYFIYNEGANTPPTSAQVNDETSASRDASIFKVVELPGKGMGAIAIRDIQQGEVILTEKPLFIVPLRINISPATLILSQLNELPQAQQEAFNNLSYVNFPSHLNPDDYPDQVALAKFQTNAVSAGENVGIFPRMARLNHGCSSAFNVVYSWRDEEQLLYVHALKSVPKGKELLASYTDPKKPRSERRAYLEQQYGFHCTCDVCSLPDALSKASDERLSKISALYDAFATWGANQIDGVKAIDHIRNIWKLEDEEGYWSQRGQLAADAAYIAAAHSDAISTQAWAALAIEWYSYEIGVDAPQVRNMRSIEAQPETHTAWGTSEPLKVGGPELVMG